MQVGGLLKGEACRATGAGAVHCRSTLRSPHALCTHSCAPRPSRAGPALTARVISPICPQLHATPAPCSPGNRLTLTRSFRLKLEQHSFPLTGTHCSRPAPSWVPCCRKQKQAETLATHRYTLFSPCTQSMALKNLGHCLRAWSHISRCTLYPNLPPLAAFHSASSVCMSSTAGGGVGGEGVL